MGQDLLVSGFVFNNGPMRPLYQQSLVMNHGGFKTRHPFNVTLIMLVLCGLSCSVWPALATCFIFPSSHDMNCGEICCICVIHLDSSLPRKLGSLALKSHQQALLHL